MSGLCKVEMSGFMSGRGPMETERIAMSQQERDRSRALREVKQKHLTQVESARRLKVAARPVQRMLIRIGERGDGGIIHQLRGQPSNRKLAAGWQQKILARVRYRYVDFGPTLAAEHLAQDGLPASRETLRKWMTQASWARSKRMETKRNWD
jgi:hypothetical protein